MSRDGFRESPVADQKRFLITSQCFERIKESSEFAGRRARRFKIVADGDEPGSTSVKRIHFIRHGEGCHNVFRAEEFAAGRRPHAKRANMHLVPEELHDPMLTETGRAEAVTARAGAKACGSIELLVTSPMRRAVQTGLSAFEDAVKSGVPVIAHELCREQFHGLDPSIYDSRKSRDVLAAQFPGVDFDSFVLPAENPPSGEVVGDPLWWHCASPFGGCEQGTNDSATSEHAYQFLCWLMSRPEKNIAVATHSIFLVALYYAALDSPGNRDVSHVTLFHTGELRSLSIAEYAAPPSRGTHLTQEASALTGKGLKRKAEGGVQDSPVN